MKPYKVTVVVKAANAMQAWAVMEVARRAGYCDDITECCEVEDGDAEDPVSLEG